MMDDQSTSHVKPTSLISGTMVSTDLKRARHMLEDAFGLECVEPKPGLLYARSPGFGKGGANQGQPYWVLEVHEKSEVHVPQEMLNHWGMDASSEAAVDASFAAIKDKKEEYGIARVQKPRFRNGSYACYFIDKDSNWWELEYRAPDLKYKALREKGDLHQD